MIEKKEAGLKSALDLAMERLEKKNGKIAALSTEQMKAKVAEIEILRNKELAEARAKGDPEEIRKLEEQKLFDIGKVRSQAESEKERVRGNG